MYIDGKILMAKSDIPCYLYPKMANRHGLIAGATGTGKTITMKVMAESFSDMGVPVFFADVKGDLTGMCREGVPSESLSKRIEGFGLENFSFKSYPTRFWDIYGEKGHPVRVTISQMGPTLLSKLLNLTDIQAGVLNIVFRVADDNGLLLLDLKDLRAMLKYVGDNRNEYSLEYGNIASASIGAIQRALLAFEEDSISFFGEPALDIKDWMRTNSESKGYINILSANKLIQNPTIYSTFLLWMMTELFEQLPEVGDLEKPRMVFFFDEAHLLFNDAPKALVQKIVQVVKLIRSKGVGVYFISQSPSDIPDDVLAQLSNRVQHGLRAYTPADMKGIRAAAQSFRVNPEFDSEEELKSLGTGEALVSFLDESGIPTVVQKAKILPPQSLMGPAPDEAVNSIIKSDEFELKYRDLYDRESAYEIITKANQKLEEEREAEKEAALKAAEDEKAAKKAAKEEKEEKAEKKSAKTKQSNTSKALQRAVTNAGSSVARSLSTNAVNSVLGGKQTSAATIGKRAATTALSSVMRSGTTSIIRGLFGNKK